MKAPAFEYSRVTTISDAIALLAEHGDEAKILAGGQSLVPALNLRLLAPKLLIDIGGVDELRSITVSNGKLVIGALARHVDVLRSDLVAAHAPLLGKAVTHVAHPAIRNRGTFGGSLAHADPASELPACVLALGATIVTRGPNGERRIPVDEYFLGIYETALEPTELLVAVEIPAKAPGSVFFFNEHARRNGDYALAGLAAQATVEGGRFTALRLGYFAVGERPVLANAAAEALIGVEVTQAVIDAAQAALDENLDPHDDLQAPADMRRYLARGLLVRCVSTLLERSDLEVGGLS